MYFKAVCALEIIMTLKYIVIMKKIILSFLLCVGVGFTMMGSPAQVGDDGNSASVKSDAAMLTVTTLDEKPVVPVKPCNGLIKHPWKVKKINVTKLKAPRKMALIHNIGSLRDLLVCNNLDLHIDDKRHKGTIQGIPRRQEPPKPRGTGSGTNTSGTHTSGTLFDLITRME